MYMYMYCIIGGGGGVYNVECTYLPHHIDMYNIDACHAVVYYGILWYTMVAMKKDHVIFM